MLRYVAKRASSSAGILRPIYSTYSVSHGFSSESASERKVTAAADGIGQPLALMKLNPFVSKPSIYDIAGTTGVAADVGRINSRSEVKGFVGEDELGETLEGAGVARKPGMTRDNLFNSNAGILNSLAAKYCSQATPKALTKRTQDGGTELVESKAGMGFAALPMVYAGAILADACLKGGLNGVPDVVDCSLMQSTMLALPIVASRGKKSVVEDLFRPGSLRITSALQLPLIFIYKKATATALLNVAVFWHIKGGIKEIMADYVHHEITRTAIMISLRLFLLIAIKDSLLSVVF